MWSCCLSDDARVGSLRSVVATICRCRRKLEDTMRMRSYMCMYQGVLEDVLEGVGALVILRFVTTLCIYRTVVVSAGELKVRGWVDTVVCEFIDKGDRLSISAVVFFHSCRGRICRRRITLMCFFLSAIFADLY